MATDSQSPDHEPAGRPPAARVGSQGATPPQLDTRTVDRLLEKWIAEDTARDTLASTLEAPSQPAGKRSGSGVASLVRFLIGKRRDR